MDTLKYDTRTINRNFRIKVVIKPTDKNGHKKDFHTIKGVSGFAELVGDMKRVNKMLDKALNSKVDKVKFKYPNYTVTFYVK